MKKTLLFTIILAGVLFFSCDNSSSNNSSDNQDNNNTENPGTSGGNEEQKAPLKGVVLTADSYDLYVGETLQLKLTLQPKNAQYNTIKYTSTNKNVATVDENGLVKGKKAGSVTIKVTVTSENGTKTDSYDIGIGNVEKFLGKIYEAKDASKADNFTKLVWTDDFTNVDTTNTWEYEVGGGGFGNGELEYYTEGDNAVCETYDGKTCLHITARKETSGEHAGEYTSTRMITRDKVSFKYGKIEAKMKFSAKERSWPAFWMLGAVNNESTNVSWPKCGEIDIMEHGNDFDYVNGTLHWNGTGCNPSAKYKHAEYGNSSKQSDIAGFTPVANLDVTEWHRYGCIWTETKIQVYVDDIVYYEMGIGNEGNGTNCFNKPFFLLLNFAVGGTNFLPKILDDKGNRDLATEKSLIDATITDNSLDGNPGWDMYVDYIKVWQDENATVTQ